MPTQDLFETSIYIIMIDEVSFNLKQVKGCVAKSPAKFS